MSHLFALSAVDPPEPWDRQDSEPERAFHAFTVYRNFGPKRTKSATARTLGLSPGAITNYSRSWDWSSRAEAWDWYMDRIFQAEMAERQRILAKSQFEMAENALQALNAPIQALLTKMETDPETTMAEFGAKDLTQLLKMAQNSIRQMPAMMTAQRLALGQPSDITAKTETKNINFNDDQRIGEVLDVLHEAGVLDAFRPEGSDGPIIDAETVEVDDDRSDTEADGLPDSST